jgi:hypothetical protein
MQFCSAKFYLVMLCLVLFCSVLAVLQIKRTRVKEEEEDRS